jgi:hypothetical protein
VGHGHAAPDGIVEARLLSLRRVPGQELPACIEVIDYAWIKGLPMAKAGEQAEAQKNQY